MNSIALHSLTETINAINYARTPDPAGPPAPTLGSRSASTLIEWHKELTATGIIDRGVNEPSWPSSTQLEPAPLPRPTQHTELKRFARKSY